MNTTKSLFIILFSVAFATTTWAVDTYTVDTSHSNVRFTVTHLMISEVEGKFSDFSGTIELDEKDFTKSSAKGTVKVASIDTGNEKRDNHLRSGDFFDAQKFPELTFETVKITKKGTSYSADTKLTIRGTTKTVPFSLKFMGTGADPWGNQKAAFKASATIKRSDFGITWNKGLETGGVLVGDEVKITLNIEADKKK